MTTEQQATEADIDRWLADGSPAAAAQIAAAARAATEKRIAKAARRALYVLGQRGIIPPSDAAMETADRLDTAAPETLRAWASAYDGAGNRMFVLVLRSAGSGTALVAQVLVNDQVGIGELTVRREHYRTVARMMAAIEAQLGEGLAVAEIEPDYARFLIDRFRAINFRRSKTTPAGFLDLLPRLGAATREYATPPLDGASVSDETPDAVPADPADLFSLPWFEPWFFAVEEVTPWLQPWIEADRLAEPDAAWAEAGGSQDEHAASGGQQGRDEAPDAVVEQGALNTRDAYKSDIAREAADGLMADTVRQLYVVRLDETADVLLRRGMVAEARQALLHAHALRTTAPARDVPFAVAIAARTLRAAAEMVAAARENSAAPGV